MSSIKNFRRKNRGRQLAGRMTGHSSGSKSLTYDVCEPRRLLAIFVVNSIGDDDSGNVDGFVTLREAIIASTTNASFGDAVAGAANGDEIRFASSLAGQTIVLTNGQLNVFDDLIIRGGNTNITIDGNSSGRIFNLATGEDVSISSVNLVNGRAVQGGAISAAGAGQTFIFDVDFNTNAATGAGGGAVYNADNDVFVTNSRFSDNLASGNSGSGGAILSVSGIVALLGTTMQTNEANEAGGAIAIIDGSLYVYDSTIGGASGLGNVAGPVGSANPGNGGAIHVTGTAGTRVVLSNSDVVGNYAAREGGGLWNAAGSTMTVRNGSTISNNVAAGNTLNNGGGGIFNNGGNVNVLDSFVIANTASGTAGSGGGIFTTLGTVYVNASTISANVANRAGGGVEVVNGLAFFRSSTLGGPNAADGNVAGPVGSASPGNGGGLHVTGNNATSVFVSSTIQNNVARREGGGLWNQTGSRLIVRTNSLIIDNVAVGTTADDGGGGIFNNGGLTVINTSEVRNNSATGTNTAGGGILSIGGSVLATDTTIASNSAASNGGGIAAIVGAYVGLTNVDLGGSQPADGNVAGSTVPSVPGSGGGVYIAGSGTALVARGSRISNNSSAGAGGGIYITQSGFARVDSNSSINSNQASTFGGGVYANGRFRAIDSAFENNIAGQAGGGLYVSANNSTRVNSSTFLSNNGGQSGGGIFNGNIAEFFDSMVSLNVVTGSGGGIFTSAGQTTLLTNTTVSGNLPDDEN
jgi:hypothetical protein